MKAITRTFTFADGAVVTATAAFSADAMADAPIRYDGPADRLAAVIGRSLPEFGQAECFRDFLGQFDGRGVRITTSEIGDWRSVTL